MKLNKTAKVALFSIPILVGIYLIYKQFRKPSPKPYIPPPTPKPTPNPTPNPSTGCDYPLRKGVYNCDLVAQVQWALNHIPSTSYSTTSNLIKYRPLAEDGDFGPKTQAVLNDFWGPQCSGDCTVDNQSDMDSIMSFVITDPAAFQAAENPYVTQPTTTNLFNPY